MLALLAGIMFLSGVDLALTVSQSMMGLMLEANPIARQIVGLGGLEALALFKLLTVAAPITVLYLARSMRSAEVAATVGLCVLLWVAFQWIPYLSIAAGAVDSAFIAVIENDPLRM